MTYDEFRRQLGKAGLTAKAFASLMKQTPNSITNYASQGKVPAHLAVIVALMGEMAEQGIDFRNTLARIDFGAKSVNHPATVRQTYTQATPPLPPLRGLTRAGASK